MKKFIIVSHKQFSQGLKDTLDFFTNMGNQIQAISAYEDGENQFPENELKQAIEAAGEGNQVIILTDMLGGSVNQHAVSYMSQDVLVITGINLAVAMSLVLNPKERLSADDVIQSIEAARDQMVLMNNYQTEQASGDE